MYLAEGIAVFLLMAGLFRRNKSTESCGPLTALLFCFFSVILIQSVYVDGPLGLFEAPYGHIRRARVAVEGIGGTFEPIDRGYMYEINLTGPSVDDEALLSLENPLEQFSNVWITLVDSSVSCEAVKEFKRKVPTQFVIRLMPDPCQK